MDIALSPILWIAIGIGAIVVEFRFSKLVIKAIGRVFDILESLLP